HAARRHAGARIGGGVLLRSPRRRHRGARAPRQPATRLHGRPGRLGEGARPMTHPMTHPMIRALPARAAAAIGAIAATLTLAAGPADAQVERYASVIGTNQGGAGAARLRWAEADAAGGTGGAAGRGR